MTTDLSFGAGGDHGARASQRAAAAETVESAPALGFGDVAPAGPAGPSGPVAGQPERTVRPGAAGQVARSTAMRAYCATLSRFTSSVQSTEQLLRNDEVAVREDTEQRELTAASRLRGIERAATAAADGLEQCAAVRSAHGLDGLGATTGHDPSGGDGDNHRAGLDRLRRSGSADLGVALTSLGRRRDALRLAEDEFAGWLARHDEQTRRVSLGVAVAAGLAAAAVMAVAGTSTSAATSLALLVVCTLAVVAVGVGVAAARRSPRVCRGVGLARRPYALGLARFGAQVGGLALLALAAANIGAGTL